MKTQFVILVAVALSGPANAQRAITTDSVNAAPATGRCSVSKNGAMTVADFNFDSVSQPIKISVGASSDRMVPPVTWHAINAKGTGTAGRSIAPPSTCDSAKLSPSVDDVSGTNGAGSNDRNHQSDGDVTAQAGRHKDMIDVVIVSTTDRNHHPNGDVAAQTTCTISGDPTNPGVSVQLTLPVTSKATFKEMTFTRTIAAGAGGLPIVNRRDAIVCVGDNGAPSDYSMLLLPAVQK